MNNAKSYKCRICQSATKFFDVDSRKSEQYTLCECIGCKTIQVVEHYHEVSPDYAHLSIEDISHDHVLMNRRHKYNAYIQFIGLMKNYGLNENNSHVVDIGCSTGGFGEFCSRLGLENQGFDSSEAQVDYANKCGLIAYKCTSVSEYMKNYYHNNQGAVIFTLWDVFEHIRDPHKLLSELNSVAIPNKYLFISIPNGGSLRWKRFLYRLFFKKYSYDSWEHVFYYNPMSLRILLGEYGFSEVDSGSIVCYPRNLGVGEIFRRIIFKVTSILPIYSPQIYSFSKFEK